MLSGTFLLPAGTIPILEVCPHTIGDIPLTGRDLPIRKRCVPTPLTGYLPLLQVYLSTLWGNTPIIL